MQSSSAWNMPGHSSRSTDFGSQFHDALEVLARDWHPCSGDPSQFHPACGVWACLVNLSKSPTANPFSFWSIAQLLVWVESSCRRPRLLHNSSMRTSISPHLFQSSISLLGINTLSWIGRLRAHRRLLSYTSVFGGHSSRPRISHIMTSPP